ncbi:phage tail protein [Hymenobacter norwichensis]|uniref:phage tail protein n=1 Tax=Hymenobacter norwichensis TaxID=223903 RepID=UPI0003B6BC56|nr:tail fiber protein [Hymenobacter norwichensis]
MDPFLGEIRLMPYYFAPANWLPCDGRLLPVRQNTALFSLLGALYGGDGQNSFALPDLRGRAIVGMGQGAGLQSYSQGEQTGTESVTLQAVQLAQHSHTLAASVPVTSATGTTGSPQGGVYASTSSEQYGFSGTNGNMANLLTGTTVPAGGNQAHENRMPFLALNYCIATQGIYPPRQ